MRSTGFALATLASLTLGVANTAAAVNVTFVNPEQYRDEDFRNSAKRHGVIGDLTRYFKRLDERYLKQGQRLDIEVLDARLAGRYEPWRAGFEDVRILRDITPPRFKLRYTLRRGGKVIVSGEEAVSDMNYLSSPSARGSSERLAYEKEMLRDWFRKRFVELRRPHG